MLGKVLNAVLPTMISTMMVAMYSVIDGLFVGGATGDIGLAAVNLAWPLTAVIFGIGVGIGGGGSVLLSYFAGCGEVDEEQATFTTVINMLFVSGVMCWVIFQSFPQILVWFGATGQVYETAYNYCEVIVAGAVIQVVGTGIMPILRSCELSVQAMAAMVTGLLCNIIANYYFLFVLEIGIKGAAYGTVISQIVVVIIGGYYIVRRTKYKYTIKLEFARVKGVINAGITIFGLYLAPSITLVFTNWQCIKYGGDLALASYSVVAYIIFPVQSILSGIGDGTQALISFYHGGEQWKQLKEIRKIAMYMVGITGVILAVGAYLSADYTARIFGLSEDAKGMYTMGMNVACIAFVMVGYVRYKLAYLNATREANKAMLYTFADSLLVSPILLFVLPLVCEINGVWLAYLGTAMVMYILLWKS